MKYLWEIKDPKELEFPVLIEDDVIMLAAHRYKIPCEICGGEVIRTQYSKKRTYICDYCKGVIKRREKAALPVTKSKEDVRFENAVKEIQKQVTDFEKYRKPIEVAKTRSHRYGSIPEAMVAIELLKNHYSFIPQQKIHNYHADFVLPKQKIVIEVDGGLYHQKKTGRDAEIQFALGFEWKIIHIPAELIRKDIQKLKQCIELYK